MQTALAPPQKPSVGVRAQMLSRPAQETGHICESVTWGYKNGHGLSCLPTSYKEVWKLLSSVYWIALPTYTAEQPVPLLIESSAPLSKHAKLPEYSEELLRPNTLSGTLSARCRPYCCDKGVTCLVSSAGSHPCSQGLAPAIVQQPASRPQVWGAAAVMVAAVIVPCAQQCILALPLCTPKKWTCLLCRCCQGRLLLGQSCALHMTIRFPEHWKSPGAHTRVAPGSLPVHLLKDDLSLPPSARAL